MLQDLEPEQPYQQLRLDAFFLTGASKGDSITGDNAGAVKQTAASPSAWQVQQELAAASDIPEDSRGNRGFCGKLRRQTWFT